MKKVFLLLLFSISIYGFSQSREWMTSLDIAKRLALVQNKMIFALWEDAISEGYPVLIKDSKGNVLVADLFENESLNEIVWEYFVPVKISESRYYDLFHEIKDKREKSYIDKFNDDSIKIMDVNGNIINTKSPNESYNLLNISSFIAKYSLNTSFLKHNLITYSTDQNFMTSYHLASKYIDFTSYTDKNIRSEIIELASIYLDEANSYVESGDSKNKIISVQAIELLKIKQNLVLNNPKKVLRQLKRLAKSEIYQANKSLFNFLNYTAFKLLKDEKNADLWKNNVSLVDLKKAKLIINNNS